MNDKRRPAYMRMCTVYLDDPRCWKRDVAELRRDEEVTPHYSYQYVWISTYLELASLIG